MIVLVWLGQLLLFFIFWRVAYMVAMKARHTAEPTIIAELVVNLAVAVLLLIAVRSLHSAWWLMPIFGAVLGVLMGHGGRRRSDD